MGWSERIIKDRNRQPFVPTGPAPRPLDVAEMRWLRELLADCLQSSRLSDWERDFVHGQRLNLQRLGVAAVLSDKQMGVLRKIEEKIHAAG